MTDQPIERDTMNPFPIVEDPDMDGVDRRPADVVAYESGLDCQRERDGQFEPEPSWVYWVCATVAPVCLAGSAAMYSARPSVGGMVGVALTALGVLGCTFANGKQLSAARRAASAARADHVRLMAELHATPEARR